MFATLKQKQQIDGDLDKLMTEALNAYDTEFKETVK
jgi:hypothetical protein